MIKYMNQLGGFGVAGVAVLPTGDPATIVRVRQVNGGATCWSGDEQLINLTA